MNHDQLERQAKKALRAEATQMMEVLRVLNRMHKAKIWLARGFDTFHKYCTRVLRMSEDSASRRLHVAALLERYPKLLTPLLLERRVHLSGLSLLYTLITDDNAERLINEAKDKSRRYIEEMRARENPKPDLSSGIRRQPVANCTLQAPSDPLDGSPRPTPSIVVGSKAFHVEIRSPGRSFFRTMMSDATRAGLERIQDMSKKSDEEIFAEMVDLYEAEMHRRKHARLKRPPKNTSPAFDLPVSTSEPTESATAASSVEAMKIVDTSGIPDPVKRAVWDRDGGRCTFVGTHGVCNATRDLEFHHKINRADGGKATVGNITLHCHAHNGYQAELDFGADFIKAVVKQKRYARRRRTGAGSSVGEPTSRYRIARVIRRRRDAGRPRRGAGDWHDAWACAPS